VPALESLAQVLPVGPSHRFSARDPASPGVACSTLVPRRALLASARVVRYAPSESVPRGTQAVSLKLAAPHFRVSTPWLSVSLAPSESVPRGTRAVSATRAVSWGPAASGPPFFQAEPSDQRPSQQAPGSPAERVSACPGRPPDPQRRRPSPRAQPSAPHRATASARVPLPTQANASATGGCGTGPHVGLGAERRIGGGHRLHSPTAWLLPGHAPGDDGVALLPNSKKRGGLRA
jgi:hypothetical protein